MMNEKKKMHNDARQFWETADNTFLGPPEYYVKQKIFLEKHVFPIIHSTDYILDVGCGNGYFTQMFSPYCHSIFGLDISKKLILEAQQTAKDQGNENAHFILINDLIIPDPYQYDIVLCMGVTSIIIDEHEFLKMLKFLKQAIKLNGYLILKDMLRIDYEDEMQHAFQHNITRSKKRYLDVLNQHGFSLLIEDILIDATPYHFSMFVMQQQTQAESSLLP